MYNYISTIKEVLFIMPNKGDSFVATLKATHIDWGDSTRMTNSREKITGECYIPIPREDAKRLGIYNSNRSEGIGENEFYAISVDGGFDGVVKVGGASRAGDIFAKNMHVSGDLKGFSSWFNSSNVHVGTQIKVEWLSPIRLSLEILD